MNLDSFLGAGNQSLPLLILVLSGVALFFARIVRDDERVTTQLLGRFQQCRGPGLVFKVPLLHQDWRKHRVGDRGVMRTANKAQFNGALVEVVAEGFLHAGAQVELKRFDGKRFVAGPVQ